MRADKRAAVSGIACAAKGGYVRRMLTNHGSPAVDGLRSLLEASALRGKMGEESDFYHVASQIAHASVAWYQQQHSAECISLPSQSTRW